MNPKNPNSDNMSTPKLRFKEFKGEWPVQRLGNYIQIRSGFSPSGYKLESSGKYPFLKVEELNNSTKYQSESRFYTNEYKDIVPKGSVIFPKRGAAILNNKVRISSVDALLDSNLMAITPIDESLVAEFLYYKIYLEKLFKIADTSTIPQINNKHIEPYKIPFPSKEEQQKIASFLSAVDEKIQQLTRKKELLEQYKKGVMQQLFSGKLRFKQPNGNPYTKWEDKKIGDFTKVIAGGTPSTLKSEYWGGDIRWMNSGELNFKIVWEVENRITKKGLDNSSTKLIPPKCVLIGLAGQGKTRGTVAINMIELCTNQSIAAIFPNERIFITEFLYHNLDMRYDELRRLSTGEGGRGGLNLQIIKALVVSLPCLQEQQKIASFLSAIDAKIEGVANQITKVQTFKKGLLQQMFV